MCAPTNASVDGWRVLVAQRWGQTIGALASVEFQLVVEMRGVGGIILASGIGIGQKSVARKWLDGEGVGGVKIQILFKTVGVEEIISDPSGWNRGKLLGIEIKLQPFS